MALQNGTLERVGPNVALLSWSPPEASKDAMLHYRPSYATNIHYKMHKNQTDELKYYIAFNEDDEYIIAGVVYYYQTFEKGTNGAESSLYPDPPLLLDLTGKFCNLISPKNRTI